MSRTVLVAGEGGLPRVLANALGRAGTSWFACHLEGHPPEGVGQSRAFRVERLGSLLITLRDEGVTRAVFAGRIARPIVDPAMVDAQTMQLVPRIAAAIARGDDGALREVIALFEEAGIAVVSAAAVAPELLELPEIGAPSERDLRDVARAREVQAALGSVDVGQGVVVAKGQVLAVEALPGTDWMLGSLAVAEPAAPDAPRAPGEPGAPGLLGGMAGWFSGPGAVMGLPGFPRPEGGVFLKAPKPAQDRRIDLPTIGPETVRRAAAAGLHGIALEAGGVLVLEGEEVARIARDVGLFLHAYAP